MRVIDSDRKETAVPAHKAAEAASALEDVRKDAIGSFCVSTTPSASEGNFNEQRGNIIDKALLLVLYPFFAFALFIGFIAYYSRGGRPMRLNIKGFGISFDLSSPSANIAEKEHHE